MHSHLTLYAHSHLTSSTTTFPQQATYMTDSCVVLCRSLVVILLCVACVVCS